MALAHSVYQCFTRKGLARLYDAAFTDFDLDHHIDMAVAANGGAQIFLNRGDGTLELSHTEEACPKGPFDHSKVVRAADLNGDGRPDLICADLSGTARWARGNGDGTFQESVLLFEAIGQGVDGNPPRHGAINNILSGDFDGDGHLDLAIGSMTNCSESGCIFGRHTFYGNGQGEFVRVDTRPAPDLTNAGDINQDGRTDLVAWGSAETIIVQEGTAQRTFREMSVNATGKIAPTIFPIADFNRDGFNDLAYLARDSGSQESMLVLQLRNADGLPPGTNHFLLRSRAGGPYGQWRLQPRQ